MAPVDPLVSPDHTHRYFEVVFNKRDVKLCDPITVDYVGGGYCRSILLKTGFFLMNTVGKAASVCVIAIAYQQGKAPFQGRKR